MDNLLTLVVATIALVLLPGPNLALIVAHSLQHGSRAGLVTVCGTTAGVAAQLVLVVAGLAAVIETTAAALSWIKWLGAIYLVILGIRTWRTPAAGADVSPAAGRNAKDFLRGAVIALLNPKILLFNAAFLPQFVDAGGDIATELGVVALVYLAVLAAGDALWAVSAASARRYLLRYAGLRNKLTGGFLCGAGIGLALARRDP